MKNNNVSIELGKVADFLKYTTALSAQTSTNFHNAEILQHKISFMFNKEKILSFDDPHIEKWFTTIKGVVRNNTLGITVGITNSELKEATRLTAGLTSLTTSLVPLKPNSEKCEDAILLKTLLIPVIQFNSSTRFTVKDGLLKESSTSDSSHTLLSKDSVISKATDLFGRKIQVIGRSCIVDYTVNSSSFTSGSFLFEN